MPGKPGKEHGLFEDGSLIAFMQSTLDAMEMAAGGQLTEERAKLHELQLALGGLGVNVPKADITNEIVLANNLQSLEEQLEAIEAQVSAADDNTRQLLTRSTAMWAGLQQDTDSNNPATSGSSGGGGSCNISESALEGNSSTTSPNEPTRNKLPSTSESHHAIASSLPPATEDLTCDTL